MYLGGKWYSLKARPDTYDNNDPIGGLDVTILSDQILIPILDIQDLRRSKLNLEISKQVILEDPRKKPRTYLAITLFAAIAFQGKRFLLVKSV